MNSNRFGWALLALLGCVAGCSSTLETGYQPRALGGSSSEIRRGYYAQPFTPEAKKAKDYQQDFGVPSTGSRATPGY